jgi:hypothetical protein
MTRTYWPLVERNRLDRAQVQILGYTDTRIMPPDLTAADGNEVVIGRPVQLLPTYT